MYQLKIKYKTVNKYEVFLWFVQGCPAEKKKQNKNKNKNKKQTAVSLQLTIVPRFQCGY